MVVRFGIATQRDESGSLTTAVIGGLAAATLIALSVYLLQSGEMSRRSLTVAFESERERSLHDYARRKAASKESAPASDCQDSAGTFHREAPDSPEAKFEYSCQASPDGKHRILQARDVSRPNSLATAAVAITDTNGGFPAEIQYCGPSTTAGDGSFNGCMGDGTCLDSKIWSNFTVRAPTSYEISLIPDETPGVDHHANIGESDAFNSYWVIAPNRTIAVGAGTPEAAQYGFRFAYAKGSIQLVPGKTYSVMIMHSAYYGYGRACTTLKFNRLSP